MKMIMATLVFVVADGKVLLSEKLDKVGKGKLNGYGGKPKAGESMRETACREFWEETGGAFIHPLELQQAALVKFCNQTVNKEDIHCTVYVYTVPRYVGTVLATKEMGPPSWYAVDALPLELLLIGDRFWLPQVLSGKQVYVTGGYKPGFEELSGEVTVEEAKFYLEW